MKTDSVRNLKKCSYVREVVETCSSSLNHPTEVVTHLRECQECQKYSRELESLKQMIMLSPRVTAPSDFDIKLRYKIANSHSHWWTRLITPFYTTELKPVFENSLGFNAALLSFAGILTISAFSFYSFYGYNRSTLVASLPDKTAVKEQIQNPPTPKENIRDLNELEEVKEEPLEVAVVKRTAPRTHKTSNADHQDLFMVLQDENRSLTVPVSTVIIGAKSIVNMPEMGTFSEDNNLGFSEDPSVF
ncbi:MAG: hypothetical protein JNN15_16200 [Blastocatellia bacterium]|nr:hypothetical protein [Blastocatellia bacterium]